MDNETMLFIGGAGVLLVGGYLYLKGPTTGITAVPVSSVGTSSSSQDAQLAYNLEQARLQTAGTLFGTLAGAFNSQQQAQTALNVAQINANAAVQAYSKQADIAYAQQATQVQLAQIQSGAQVASAQAAASAQKQSGLLGFLGNIFGGLF